MILNHKIVGVITGSNFIANCYVIWMLHSNSEKDNEMARWGVSYLSFTELVCNFLALFVIIC